MQNRNDPLPSLKPLVVLLFGLMVAFHLGCALKGRSFIRASHLGTALEYAQGSVDLMRPHLIGFNANGAPTAQELPLWQAATAVVFKLMRSTWYGWGNLVSLTLFASALWPFYRLSREYLGERAAGWATVFFLSEPLIIVYGGEAATDGFCMVLTVWFLYFADLLVRTGAARWWLPAAILGALAAVGKLPFFMAAGLCSVCMLLVHQVRDWRRWAMLAAVGMFSAVALFAWGRHADSLAAQAEFPYYELRVSQNPHLQLWYFGDLHSRLSAGAWIKGGWRFLHATLGYLPFAAILAVAFVQRGNRLAKLWLLMTFVTTLVFTPLVLNHWHYYLMCAPPVAMLCGAVLARWEPFLASELPSPGWRTAIMALALLGSALAGLITMKISLELDDLPQQIATILREQSQPGDKLVVYGEPTWGGEVLFRAGRQGLSVFSLDGIPGVKTSKGLKELLSDDANLGRLKSLGFTKLVLLSESPVRFAVQASNPGSKRTRLYYPESVTPSVDAWPVIYKSEDILIRAIP